MDETYQIYINRVAPLTLPATYQSQLQNIQKSPKFEGGKPVSFPGYSVMTPPACEDVDNREFYQHLSQSCQQIQQQLGSDLIIPLPPESFHLTVADLIWDSAYRDAIQNNPNFDQQLKQCIRESFQDYQQSAVKGNINQWQILGLLVFPRSLVVSLVPKDESSYEQIAQLRSAIYQNPNLISLGIEQQYHFTAHITLGYFGDINPNIDRSLLADTIGSLNEIWIGNEPEIFTIKQVELRIFKDMIVYEKESDAPVIHLSKSYPQDSNLM